MDWIIPVGLLLVTIFSGAIGWWCKTIWSEVQLMNKSLNDTRVEMPREYIRRAEYEADILRIERVNSEAIKDQKEWAIRLEGKVDSIVQALSNKADRTDGKL